MKKPGYFVVSLDFELMWGMFDKVTIDSYGEQIRGVHAVVPELLALFAARDIHATWATVGMLTVHNRTELETLLPSEAEQPQYRNTAYSSYQHFHQHVTDDKRDYYFAPALVEQIIKTPGQELASHTFSHYYCLEDVVGGKQGKALFAADCRALTAAFARFNTTPTSIVFPRNQTSTEALAVAATHGLIAYRGTEAHWLYRARAHEAQSNLIIRGLRLLDHYINISGHHSYHLPAANALINLPASRFLRPYTPRLKFLEPLRLRRIKNAMTHAAKTGEVFHLWWHPHNFGANRKENLAFLIAILEHFAYLKTEYGMESNNMTELATRVRELPAAPADQSVPTRD